MQRGFTLIEVSVTIGVLVIMMTISTLMYRTAGQRQEVTLTAQEAASFVRLAETYAASAKENNNDAAQNAWGIYAAKGASQLILFIDKNNNHLYDGSAEDYQTMSLPNQIKVDDVYYKTGAADYAAMPEGRAALVFTPPDPAVSLCRQGNDCVPTDEVRIVFKEGLGNTTADILVNFFGLIDAR